MASGLWWRLPGQANGILVQEIYLKSPSDLRRKSLRYHGVKLSEERYRGSPSILGSMEAFNSIEDKKSNDGQWGCC